MVVSATHQRESVVIIYIYPLPLESPLLFHHYKSSHSTSVGSLCFDACPSSFLFWMGKLRLGEKCISWLSSLTSSQQTWDSNPHHLTLVQCSFHGQRGSGVALNPCVPFSHMGCPLQFKLTFTEYTLGIKQQTQGHLHTHFIQSLQPEEFFGNQTVQTRKEGCHQGYKMKGKSSQSVNWPEYISFSRLQVLQLLNEYVLNYL